MKAFVLALCIGSMVYATDLNMLHDVSCVHKSGLEVGTLCLNFSQDPQVMVNTIDKSRNGFIELFIPQCKIKDTQKINKDFTFAQHIPCSITVQQSAAPREGIKLVMQYDPKQIKIDHDEVVDTHKGSQLVIRVHDISKLSRLQQHNKPILRLL